MISVSEWQKIGMGIMGFGIFFILFGILLYFDSVLLAFGNILFLCGLSFIIGLRRTFGFFFQRHKLKGTSFFLGGVIIVLMRWPLLGMALETYGFINLFREVPIDNLHHQYHHHIHHHYHHLCHSHQIYTLPCNKERGFFPVAFGFLASSIPFLSSLFQRLQGTSSMV